MEQLQYTRPETRWRLEMVVSAGTTKHWCTVLVLLATAFLMVKKKRPSFYVAHSLAQPESKGSHRVLQTDDWTDINAWKDKDRKAVHHKNGFIILIVFRGQISICTFYNILLSVDCFIHCLYINNFQISLYMLLGLTFPGQMKQKHEEKGTWLLLSSVSNTVQRNKEL